MSVHWIAQGLRLQAHPGSSVARVDGAHRYRRLAGTPGLSPTWRVADDLGRFTGVASGPFPVSDRARGARRPRSRDPSIAGIRGA